MRKRLGLNTISMSYNDSIVVKVIKKQNVLSHEQKKLL